MAVCKVIKPILGWNFGDRVEAFGDRLKELKESGVLEVLVPDEKSTVVEKEVKEKKRMMPMELKDFRIENLKKARAAKLNK